MLIPYTHKSATHHEIFRNDSINITNSFRALLENNESLRHFHCFEHPSTCHQWEYFDQLLKYANVKNWIPPVFSKISMHFTEAWRKQPCEYRKVSYKILNEEEFEFEKI